MFVSSDYEHYNDFCKTLSPNHRKQKSTELFLGPCVCVLVILQQWLLQVHHQYFKLLNCGRLQEPVQDTCVCTFECRKILLISSPTLGMVRRRVDVLSASMDVCHEVVHFNRLSSAGVASLDYTNLFHRWRYLFSRTASCSSLQGT